MQTAKLLTFIIVLNCVLWQNSVLSQPEGRFRLQGKLGGILTSNVNRQPDIETDEDFRMNFLVEADRKWQGEKKKLTAFYAFQHYRYNDFNRFTRYEQTLKSQFQYFRWKGLRLSVSDEFRLRLHEISNETNFGRNVFELNVRKPTGSDNYLVLGYQNWLKNYFDNGSLKKYVSNRFFIKFNHEFNRTANLITGLEYQRHRGNLYARSTALDKALDAVGKRVTFRLNLDKLFNRKLVTSLGYKFERDFADDFDIDDILLYEDEEGEELLAEDADFGYMKHQGSLSLLYRLNQRWSVLVFYLAYNKGFDFWRLERDEALPDTTKLSPRRRDTVMFFSPKIRYKLSSKFDFDIRFNFEKNWTNERSYRYTINAVGIGLSFRR